MGKPNMDKVMPYSKRKKMDNKGSPKVPPDMNSKMKIHSYNDLAKRVGTDRGFVSKMYRGLAIPSVPMAIKFAWALGISVDRFLRSLPGLEMHYRYPKKIVARRSEGYYDPN